MISELESTISYSEDIHKVTYMRSTNIGITELMEVSLITVLLDYSSSVDI